MQRHTSQLNTNNTIDNIRMVVWAEVKHTRRGYYCSPISFYAIDMHDSLDSKG